MKAKLNISRLTYLLELYRISQGELLDLINSKAKLKHPIKEDDIFADEVKISHLKRVDKIFNKGLSFYVDPSPISVNKSSNIFFRKDHFQDELNIGSKKIVNQFEDLKSTLSTISKLSNLKLERNFPIFKINKNPKDTAEGVRNTIYPKRRISKKRDFLKQLIENLAEQNVLVFEFVEHHNLTHKANINGFFIQPNFIVLKRQQRSLSRELFTLAHELGHYLLNKEEIEDVEINFKRHNVSKIENWCNEFAFHFLAGSFSDNLDRLEKATEENNFHQNLIKKMSSKTHLSTLALYTRLLYKKKISKSNYQRIKNSITNAIKLKEDEQKQERELQKELGFVSQARQPKPINSPLYLNLLKTGLYEGVINEMDFCKHLKIKPEKIDQYV
ncbi:MAG: ImmA/IrrE family metallo-endopeptidase [Bacteroidetes bacterium]|nr:ImmA/IrrE family metallo-endopeptidase [Bacteroidota bacterium]